MEFYLESMKNDLDIASMECDISLDRASLTMDYYTNIGNFYKESGREASEEWMTEAGGKVGEALKKAVNAVIEFINKCIDKIKEAFAKARLKALVDKYNKLVKEKPEFAGWEVEYTDVTEWVKQADNTNQKAVKMLKKAIDQAKFFSRQPDVHKYINDVEDDNHRLKQDNDKLKYDNADLESWLDAYDKQYDELQNDYDKLYEDWDREYAAHAKTKKKVKKIKIGAAIALLGTAAAGVLATMQMRKKTLDDAGTALVKEAYPTDGDIISKWKGGKLSNALYTIMKHTKTITDRERDNILELQDIVNSACNKMTGAST